MGASKQPHLEEARTTAQIQHPAHCISEEEAANGTRHSTMNKAPKITERRQRLAGKETGVGGGCGRDSTRGQAGTGD